MNESLHPLQVELIERVAIQSPQGTSSALRRIVETAGIASTAITPESNIENAFKIAYDGNVATQVVISLEPVLQVTPPGETIRIQPREALQLFLSPPPRLRRLSREQREFFTSGQARLFAKILPPEQNLDSFRAAGFSTAWTAVPTQYPYPYLADAGVFDGLWAAISHDIGYLGDFVFYHNIEKARRLPAEHQAAYDLEKPQTVVYIHIRPLEEPIIGVPPHLQTNLGEWVEEYGISPLAIPSEVEKIPVQDARQMDQIFQELGLVQLGLTYKPWDYNTPTIVRGITLRD